MPQAVGIDYACHWNKRASRIACNESTRPDFVKADAVVKTGLIGGLAEIQDVASPMPASWNQIAGWLEQMDALRQAA